MININLANNNSELSDNHSPASYFAVVLLYAAIYLKDIASAWVSTGLLVAFIGGGLTVGLTTILVRGRLINQGRISILFTVGGMLAWLVGVLLNGSINFSAYYIAIPCAFIIANTNPRFFLKLLVIHLIVSLGIEAVEYATGKYLFIYQAADGTELNEKLFGGGLDVFRAKGFFQGPLSAVAFSLWLALFAQGRLLFAGVLMFSAFFAGGRLGMSIAAILLVTRIWASRTLKDRAITIAATRTRTSLAMLTLFVAVMVVLFFYADSNRLLFISSAFDLSNDQNVSRLFFWLLSLRHFISYSGIEMLVGKFGFILHTEGATENDFLRILLDHGFIGLLLYVGALFRLFIVSIRYKNYELAFTLLIIIILMNVFPFIQSLSSTLLFWIFVFLTPYFLDNNRYALARLTRVESL